jgi:hypothetical protein
MAAWDGWSQSHCDSVAHLSYTQLGSFWLVSADLRSCSGSQALANILPIRLDIDSGQNPQRLYRLCCVEGCFFRVIADKRGWCGEGPQGLRKDSQGLELQQDRSKRQPLVRG